MKTAIITSERWTTVRDDPAEAPSLLETGSAVDVTVVAHSSGCTLTAAGADEDLGPASEYLSLQRSVSARPQSTDHSLIP